MIHTEETRVELGTIKIHDNVIASISYLAALEVDGISRICDDIWSHVYQILGKKTKSGAIAIKPEKMEGVSITIPIIIKYGYNIPEVASKVQEKVKSVVEESTDLTIKDIIIKIKGVEK